MDDILVVVIAQPAAQLLVVHFGLVLAQAPQASNLNDNKKNNKKRTKTKYNKKTIKKKNNNRL